MAKISASTVNGVREILVNLDIKQALLLKKFEEGLVKAGLYLQKVSQEKVPVEFGNLKASAYTRKKNSGAKTEVYVGYTAEYALWVHEKVGMKLKGKPRRPSPPHIGRYWDPQGRAQAKFLEEPARTEVPKMRRIIVEHAKIR
jgi:hypothetical protein